MMNTIKKVKNRAAILIAIVAFTTLSASSQELPRSFTGKVVGIHDGDSVTLLINKTQYKIRLAEIDAPELGQAFGNKSKQALSDMVFGQLVFGQVETKDRYGRNVCHLMTAKHRVNEEMVQNGFAWRFNKYSKSKKFTDLQAKAKAEELGLWADSNPIPPWEYRDQVKRERLAKKMAEEKAAKPSLATSTPSKLVSPAIATRKSAKHAMSFWLTSSSNVRHNSSCRWYHKSKGRACHSGEGKACSMCGG